MAEWLDLSRVGCASGATERVVAYRDGVALNHVDFCFDVRRWHAAFAASASTRVALFFEDAYAFSAALFGALHAGKEVVVPGDAQPATLESLRSRVQAFAGELPGALTAAQQPGSEAVLPLDLRAAKLEIYTSGSNGQPLAINKRLEQFNCEIRHLETAFGARIAGDAVIHSTVSHQHIYGLLFVSLWPLASGRAINTQRLAYPEQMAPRLSLGPSVLVSSPANLQRLPDSLDWRGTRRQLVAVFSSGGPLLEASAQQCLELLGQSPIEVYGSSETGGIAWRQRSIHAAAWQPLPGVQWQVLDEQGTLLVQSDHLDQAGWYETSDRVQALDEGRFLLIGRADRIVKVEEKRVSLSALEAALLATGLLDQARALLVPAERGHRVAVVAVPTSTGRQVLASQGRRALNETLRQALSQAFERVALPRRFRYVSELPVNSQGKSTEALLLRLFDDMYPPAQWLERSATRAVLMLDIHPELRVFDGHFSSTPLLAGVAQLDWAVEFGVRAFALSGTPAVQRISDLKFRRPVVPPAQLELTLEWRADARELAFRYEAAQTLHSHGLIHLMGPDV